VATLAVAPVAQPDLEIQPSPGSKQQVPQRLGRRTGRADQFAQALVLAVLFAVPALICVHMAVVADPDIWWHLRTGEWIEQHRAVPHVDLFSAQLAGKPWLAYSWLFELAVLKLFQWFGLAGLVAYSAAMILAITVALNHLVRRLQADFSLAVLLTFAGLFSMGHMYTPRPWMFTILLFVFEIDILMHARKTGKLRELAWLPLIFALWANLHIEFVDGLFVLGLALAEAVLARWRPELPTRIRPVWMGVALLASALATLANPYGWRIYAVAHDLATQAGPLNTVTELQAIPFRDLADFVVLGLALASAAALAWRSRWLSFEGGLLAFAAVLAFRSQRDVWLLATAASAILASAMVARETPAIRIPKFAALLIVLASSLAVLAGFRVLHVNNQVLETKLAASLPVGAVETIQQKGYAGPVFNDFSWGGYLIWNLRVPVSIDGRQNLYGDERIDRSGATWSGQPGWDSDAQLHSAGVVVGPVRAPLTQLLRLDPKFQLAYEDKVAAVFVARR
jgi:hypothetical protein